jgi:NAD(P)-dependent dehydrogenase (short-subunit alcohol dehydrogenase family)
MARVFITGSSDGLGRMAAQLLVEQGHSVVLHARNEQRGEEAMSAVPGAETVVVGDLSSIRETRKVANQVNALGSFDAVIHNAGLGYRESRPSATEDGMPTVFAVNTLAPYILSALIHRPKALGLREFRSASGRGHKPQGPVMGTAQVAAAAGLLRHQASRRASGICGRALLA